MNVEVFTAFDTANLRQHPWALSRSGLKVFGKPTEQGLPFSCSAADEGAYGGFLHVRSIAYLREKQPFRVGLTATRPLCGQQSTPEQIEALTTRFLIASFSKSGFHNSISLPKQAGTLLTAADLLNLRTDRSSRISRGSGSETMFQLIKRLSRRGRSVRELPDLLRYALNAPRQAVFIRNPEDLASYLKATTGPAPEGHIRAIAINSDSGVVADRLFERSAFIFSELGRAVATFAWSASASALFVIARNPEGSSTRSAARHLAHDIFREAQIVEVDLLDFVLIEGKGAFSLTHGRLLPEPGYEPEGSEP